MSGVVSVGAAVGASALAASSVATVGMTAGSMFAVMGAVGAVAGAVGKLTGVKELALGGAALGAVGGIGSIASSAGLFGAGEGLFNTGANVAGEAATDAGTWGASAGGAMGADGGTGMFANVGDLISGKGLSTDVIGGITGTAAPANTLPLPVDHAGNVIPQGGGEGTPLGNVANPGASGVLIDAPPAVAPGPAPTTPLPGLVDSGNPPISAGPYQSTMPAGTDIPIVTLAPGQTQPTAAAPDGDSSTWGGILKFMKDNPSLTMGGIMAASSFLSGAFNPKSGAEVNALNASAARSNAEAGLINRQTSNMSQALPGATRTRTNTGTGRIDRLPA